jgi:hypothetical protein
MRDKLDKTGGRHETKRFYDRNAVIREDLELIHAEERLG